MDWGLLLCSQLLEEEGTWAALKGLAVTSLLPSQPLPPEPLPGERQAVPARLNAKCQPHVTQRLLANRGAPSGGRPGPGLVPPGPGLSPFRCHSSDYSPWEVTPLVVWVTCLGLGTCQRRLVFRKLEGCGRPSLSRVLGAGGWVEGTGAEQDRQSLNPPQLICHGWEKLPL